MVRCKVCKGESNSRRFVCKQCEEAVIKDYFENPRSTVLIGKKYGLSHETIREIVKRNGYNVRGNGSLSKKHSEETKKKISKSLKGRKLSEKCKRKIGESLVGHIGANKGKLGAESANWQNGGYFFILHNWQLAVLLRDNFCCQDCGMTEWESVQKWHKKLDCHHVDGNNRNNRIENGRTLCRSCHTRLHNKQGDCGFRKRRA